MLVHLFLVDQGFMAMATTQSIKNSIFHWDCRGRGISQRIAGDYSVQGRLDEDISANVEQD